METIKAKITGTNQEIMVDIDLGNATKDTRFDNFLESLTKAYAKKATDELEVEELNEDEYEYLTERLSDKADEANVEDNVSLATAIVDGTLYKVILETVKPIVNKRASFYTFTVNYSGTFEVTVKAHEEEEARAYLENMSHYDFIDLAEIDADTEFEVDECIAETDDEDSVVDDFMDATED